MARTTTPEAWSRLHLAFSQVGRDLFISGAVTTHGGNLSMTDGERIWISRTNSMLGRMSSDDIIETSFSPHEGSDREASRELVVHRAMYEAYARAGGDLSAGAAIVHAHSKHSIARSLCGGSRIMCEDSEGDYTLGDGVPVVTSATSVASAEAGEKIAEHIARGERIVMLHGHGPFALGTTLVDALRLVSVLEASCQIGLLRRLMERS